MMTLSQLCEGIVSIPGEAANLSVDGVASDSRAVVPGCLFVAVSGYATDGHKFIPKAVENGANLIITEKPVENLAVPVIQVADSRKVLALLANRFFGDLSNQLALVGITGTNGKTTTAFLLERIFETAGLSPGLLGTVTYRWQGREEDAQRTTPDVLDLHNLLKRMRDDGSKSVIMEVSSHALALERVTGLTFKAGIFTNLTRDHLDFHNNFDDYRQAKSKLFSLIHHDGVAVVNGDDPSHTAMIQKAHCKTITFGIKNPNVRCPIKDIHMNNTQSAFQIQWGGRDIPISTHLLGRYNIMNVAAAVLVGLEMGIQEENIRQGLDSVLSIPGRTEQIRTSLNFKVFVDYAHTPDALQNVLIAAREFTQNRLICVFGCGGDRDRGKRPEMGRIGSAFSDLCVVTSDNPRTEDPDRILLDIIEGLDMQTPHKTIADRKDAIRFAIQTAKQGDTVVIAGKGHETYQQVGNEKFPFDDRVVARDCLAELETL